MISSACNCALEQRIIAMNPTKGRALPKLEKKKMIILPLNCLGTFFEEAKRSGVFKLYHVNLSTGLRCGEPLRQMKRQSTSEYVFPSLTRRPYLAGQRSA